MVKRNIKIYKPKFLIDGSIIQQEGMFVAIPDKGYKKGKIKVIYDNHIMEIKNWHKAVTFRRFHDKFGGPDYTLAYFKWEPFYSMYELGEMRNKNLVRVEKNGYIFWEEPNAES